jgi:hypothetical protein
MFISLAQFLNNLPAFLKSTGLSNLLPKPVAELIANIYFNCLLCLKHTGSIDRIAYGMQLFLRSVLEIYPLIGENLIDYTLGLLVND